MRKPLKSALHHWWPKSVSQFWAEVDGMTNRLSWNDQIVHAPPAQFGGMTNAHHIKLSDTHSPWDSSFESKFDAADTKFPSVIDWLLNAHININVSNETISERLEPQISTEKMLENIAECIASLIVRSPRFRNQIRITTEYYRKRMGLVDFKANDPLIGANMRQCPEMFSNAIKKGGKYVILHSGACEFIFGDGFLHNFSDPVTPPVAPICLVPLVPTISMLYIKPISYRTDPRIMKMSLLPDEVEFLNQTVQVYSRDYVFFRSKRPRTVPEFSQREFLEYERHSCPWLDTLIMEVRNA